MSLDKRIKLFVLLAGIFVTALVVGDLIGGKLLQTIVGDMPFVISVGMIPFPITFLLTDLLNEFYGRQAARFVTWVGFFMASFAFLVIAIAKQLPWADFTAAPEWQGMRAEAFNNVFGTSQRMLIASMTAYLVAQLFDIAVFHFIKRKTANRLLWLRATGSTVCSQLIDTVVIQTLAWSGLLPVTKILSIIATSYAFKVLVAIGVTPLIYLGHALVERRCGMRAIRLDADGHAY